MRRTISPAAWTSSDATMSLTRASLLEGPLGHLRSRGPPAGNHFEDRSRHLGLRRPGNRLLAVGGDDRHLVLGGVETDVRAGDVVDDDRVQALALELLAAIGDRAVAV